MKTGAMMVGIPINLPSLKFLFLRSASFSSKVKYQLGEVISDFYPDNHDDLALMKFLFPPPTSLILPPTTHPPPLASSLLLPSSSILLI